MGIEAKQSGNQVLIKSGNHSTQVSGKLVGYTSKAVYIVNGQNVNIYVKNVFLSVFSFFNNLSIYFKSFHHFHTKNHTYILSYKIAKKSSVLGKFVEVMENKKNT